MGYFTRAIEQMAENAEINLDLDRRNTAGTVAPVEKFGTIELDAETIADLNDSLTDERAVTIRPNKQGGGIEVGVDLLRAVHSSKCTNSFEMRNINERVGFQFVMGDDSARRKLVRQLAGFYPDSHIEVSEYENPPLLPLHEGWSLCGATFRLRRRKNGEHLFPIRHAKNEGFENDPYNSITSEMVGEKEADEITNVALQVVFEPAPNDWYKGNTFLGKALEPGIDEVVKRLKNPKVGNGPSRALKAYAKNIGPNGSPEKLRKDLKGQSREPTDEEKQEAKYVLTQRGEKGYWINIRVMAVGQNPEKAAQRVQETAAMFEGYYDSSTEQGFEILPLSGKELLKEAKRAHARERKDMKMVMDLIAASGLMHIPCDDINTQSVEWSMTSFAGDVPADAPRFTDFIDDESWNPDARTHVIDDDADEWPYAISSSWDGYKTDKWTVEDAFDDAEGEGAES